MAIRGLFEDRAYRKRIYISGMITGLDYDHVKEKFKLAEEHLLSNEYIKAQGYSIVNPIKLCSPNLDWIDCMEKCIEELIQCKCIYMLPDWRCSKGSRIEYTIALYTGIKIVTKDNEKQVFSFIQQS